MSLFGAPSTSTAPTFSFGAPASAAPAAPAASTPSLFGSTPAAAPAAGGGLFGAKPAGTTPSLFGSTPAAPATGGGGGLFGSTATSAAPGAAAPKPAFSFGTPTASTSTAPATGGLFGASAAPAPAAGGGLFGSTTTPAAGGLGGGLFGAKPAAPATGGGLFGSTAAAPAPALGASTAAPAAAGQAAAGGGAITKTTKFQDLPDAARGVVEEMDKFIRQQSSLADELKKKDLGAEIEQARRMFEQYSAESSTVSTLLCTDSRLLASLKSELEQALSDLAKTTALIDGFKQPGSQKAAEAKAVATFPYEYFRRKADEMSERVGRYRGTMEQLSALLTSTHTLSPSAIAPTLKAQHSSLVSLASAVSALDLELKGLKEEYRVIYREKTGRTADPFRGNGGLERGVGGLAIR
ncbi:hypothetical protein JCM10213_003457 [Rhodosporidiobolus nylandii]